MKKISFFLCAMLLFLTITSCVEPKDNKTLSKENSSIDAKKVNNTDEELNKKDIILLPDADEDTVKLTIEIPKEFIEKEYDICTVPEIVSNEDFEWGEYVPLVYMIGIDNVSASEDVKAMAILSEYTCDLLGARRIYSEFNNKYLVECESKVDYMIHADRMVSDYPEISDYLFKSRIEYTSTDLTRMIRYSFSPKENDEKYYMRDAICCEYIENGEIVYTRCFDELDNLACFYLGPYFYDANTLLKNTNNNKNQFIKDCYLYFDSESGNYQLYSLNEVKMIYYITVPKGYSVRDYNSCGVLLESNIFPCPLYYYNFSTQEVTFVDSLAFNSSLSPDGNYIVYTSADYDSAPDFQVKENGFYIRNVKAGCTTLFSYPYENYKSLGINCWLKKEILTKQIGATE